jgi:hypothetical protein
MADAPKAIMKASAYVRESEYSAPQHSCLSKLVSTLVGLLRSDVPAKDGCAVSGSAAALLGSALGPFVNAAPESTVASFVKADPRETFTNGKFDARVVGKPGPDGCEGEGLSKEWFQTFRTAIELDGGILPKAKGVTFSGDLPPPPATAEEGEEKTPDKDSTGGALLAKLTEMVNLLPAGASMQEALEMLKTQETLLSLHNRNGGKADADQPDGARGGGEYDHRFQGAGAQAHKGSPAEKVSLLPKTAPKLHSAIPDLLRKLDSSDSTSKQLIPFVGSGGEIIFKPAESTDYIKILTTEQTLVASDRLASSYYSDRKEEFHAHIRRLFGLMEQWKPLHVFQFEFAVRQRIEEHPEMNMLDDHTDLFMRYLVAQTTLGLTSQPTGQIGGYGQSNVKKGQSFTKMLSSSSFVPRSGPPSAQGQMAFSGGGYGGGSYGGGAAGGHGGGGRGGRGGGRGQLGPCAFFNNRSGNGSGCNRANCMNPHNCTRCNQGPFNNSALCPVCPPGNSSELNRKRKAGMGDPPFTGGRGGGRSYN